MKPIAPTTMPAIAPADSPLPSALSSLSFGMSVLPGALVPVNDRQKGQTITICPLTRLCDNGVTICVYFSIERNLGSPYQFIFILATLL